MIRNPKLVAERKDRRRWDEWRRVCCSENMKEGGCMLLVVEMVDGLRSVSRAELRAEVRAGGVAWLNDEAGVKGSCG